MIFCQIQLELSNPIAQNALQCITLSLGYCVATWRAATKMDPDKESALREKLITLRQEHRDLDAAIAAYETSSNADQLQITRLKKKKLALKDEIGRIEDQLLPDIIA